MRPAPAYSVGLTLSLTQDEQIPWESLILVWANAAFVEFNMMTMIMVMHLWRNKKLDVANVGYLSFCVAIVAKKCNAGVRLKKKDCQNSTVVFMNALTTNPQERIQWV